MKMRYELYRDRSSQWRWRLWSINNRIIADSGEGYINKRDCIHAIGLVKNSYYAEIRDPEPPPISPLFRYP